MAGSKGWGKKLFQSATMLLVVWGIYHSVRKSTTELGKQRIELQERAQQLRQDASQAGSTDRERLQQEAAQIELTASRFWSARPAGLLLAGCVYCAGMLPASLFWRRCLITLEQPAPLLDVLWAYFYGNLGKYFPGKAMVIVLRLQALERFGIKKTATSMTIFMETLTMMAVGGAVGALCMILLGLDWRLTLLACGLLLGTFIPTSPPLFRWLLRKLQRGVDSDTLDNWSNRITWRLLLRGWLMLLLTWLAFGFSLLLVLRSLPIAEFGGATWPVILLSSLGASALAVVLGFVSLIPGGAGVREVVLSVVLTPIVGPVAALCGALWLRIVWLCTELCIVGILALVRMGGQPVGLPAVSEPPIK